MKALITGVNGFVGTYLTQYLLKKNIDIIGVDRHVKTEQHFEQHCIDINDMTKMQQLISKVKPEYIYHLAAPAFIPDSYDNPKGTFETIIFGTVNILEIIRNTSPCSKLLYIGSSDEYGINENNTILKEDMLPRPYTPYAAAKLSASLICQQYAYMYDLNVVRTRSFNHCGPGQSAKFVSAAIAKQIAEMEKKNEGTLNLGDISTSRDFLDVRDVVRAYYLIMQEENNAGELYNVCSGKAIAIKYILDQYMKASTIDLGKFCINISKNSRKFDAAITIGDNTKLKKIGWKQKYKLEDTLVETLEYWRRHA